MLKATDYPNLFSRADRLLNERESLDEVDACHETIGHDIYLHDGLEAVEWSGECARDGAGRGARDQVACGQAETRRIEILRVKIVAHLKYLSWDNH